MGRGVTATVLLAVAIAVDALPVAAGGSLAPSTQDAVDPATCQDAAVDDAGRLSLAHTWDSETISAVTRRYHSGMAYDRTRQKAILFGGLDADGSSLGDTWKFDASVGWSQLAPDVSPSPRYGFAFIWTGDDYLLFAGDATSQTWVFNPDAVSWSLLALPLTPPAGIIYPAMAFSSAHARAVLFGGGQGDTTWVYDVGASSWFSPALASGPSDRYGASMAYDEDTGSMILFGGQEVVSGLYLNDTWAFSLASLTWAQLSVVSPPAARAHAAMAYDDDRRRLALFGGKSGANSFDDVYFFDAALQRWTEAADFSNSDRPTARYGHGMFYDSASGYLRAFAGKLSDNQPANTFWTHHLSTYGVCASVALSVSSATAVRWSSLLGTDVNLPAGTSVQYQVAFSSDGASFGGFRGPDATTSTYYSSESTSMPQAAGEHYLKVKTYLYSYSYPKQPALGGWQLNYDRAPEKPVLSAPVQGVIVNDLRPVLTFGRVNDPDGLGDGPLAYQVQVASDVVLAYPFLNDTGLSAGVFSGDYAPTADLFQG
ncbi:MAG: kelch repeat-containing protein, partial [Elusimicrobiota bacterium]